MEGNYVHVADYWGTNRYERTKDTLQRVAFKLRDSNGRIENKLYFAINPSQMSYNYPIRNVFTQTMGSHPGMQGYGQGLHTIQIQGQTGYNKYAVHHRGPVGKDTGYDRIKKLKHLILKQSTKGHDNFLANRAEPENLTALEFDNYTDGDEYIVEMSPQGITINRSNINPLAYVYSISMTVIRKVSIPSVKSSIHLGNIGNAFARTAFHVTRGLPYSPFVNFSGFPFNTLYKHYYKPNGNSRSRLLSNYKNGRRSITDILRPKYNINSFEKKSSFNPVRSLTVAQKVGIFDNIGKPGLIHLGKNGRNVLNLRLGPNTPNSVKRSYWRRWAELTRPYKTGRNLTSTDIGNVMRGLPFRYPPFTKGLNIDPGRPLDGSLSRGSNVGPYTNGFRRTKNGNFKYVWVPQPGVIRSRNDNMDYIPKDDFAWRSPALASRIKDKSVHFFKDKGFNPNGVQGGVSDPLASVITSDHYGNLTVSPISNINVDNLITIIDVNGNFRLEANWYHTPALERPYHAHAVYNYYYPHLNDEGYWRTHNWISCYVDVPHHQKYNGQDLKIDTYNTLDSNPYVAKNRFFTIADCKGQMRILSNPSVAYLINNFDNWAYIRLLNNGNILIQPSGPINYHYVNNYQEGMSGSHTVYAHFSDSYDYVIVPNNNSEDTRAYEVPPLERDDSYSNVVHEAGSLYSAEESEELSNGDILKPVEVNGNERSFKVSSASNTKNVPHIDLSNKTPGSDTRVEDVNRIEGNSSEKIVSVPKENDDESSND